MNQVTCEDWLQCFQAYHILPIKEDLIESLKDVKLARHENLNNFRRKFCVMLPLKNCI